jgi:hypothetical protein
VKERRGVERAGDGDVEVGRERPKEREGIKRGKRRKGRWNREEELGPAIFQTDRRQ